MKENNETDTTDACRGQQVELLIDELPLLSARQTAFLQRIQLRTVDTENIIVVHLMGNNVKTYK